MSTMNLTRQVGPMFPKFPSQNDSLSDFRLFLRQGKLHVETGSSLPRAARAYLESYVQKTHRYKNALHSDQGLRFSLYQPDLLSLPGHRSLHYRLRRKFERARLPAVATIGITKNCQCACEHCSADYHMQSMDRELTSLELKRALREAAELGATNLILLGGEPLIRKDLSELISSVDPRLACVTMFTNGELLTQKKCKELKERGLSGIFVSLDSPFAEEHDFMRKREGLFSKALEGIKHAQEAQIPVAISSYLTSERVQKGYFEKTLELGKRLGVNEVTFFDAIPVGRLSGGPCSFLDASARKRIQELTALYRKKADYPAVAPQSILTSEGGSSFCFAANTQFYLSSTGEFCPCDFTPLSIGRFPEKSIAELWQALTNSPLYKRRSKVCRMQDPVFRARTLERIPKQARLPYPIANLVQTP